MTCYDCMLCILQSRDGSLSNPVLVIWRWGDWSLSWCFKARCVALRASYPCLFGVYVMHTLRFLAVPFGPNLFFCMVYIGS